VLIKPNPGYFNSKLSRSSPQFFLVNITGNEKEVISAKVMTDIIKNFDFTALKNMLGK
jgi:predicted lysophospholipase L1 biosynthesis ABC-type transport system permease subunit